MECDYKRCPRIFYKEKLIKLHILSDIHTEFGCNLSIPEIASDILILAGDIGVGLGGFHWIKKHFPEKELIYIPGNHEFYNHDIDSFKELKEKIPPNFHIGDNFEWEYNGVRFLCCTLWTDFELFGKEDITQVIWYANSGMNDFQLISKKAPPKEMSSHGKTQRFTAFDSLFLHQKSLAWLKEKLKTFYWGKTVIVTHHAPSIRSVPGRYHKDTLNAAFTSNLEYIMKENRIALWIHGHTHDSFDYKIGETRVICNPKGYEGVMLNPDFNPGLVVEV